MSELASPFVRLWSWVENVGGFPGQVFLVCLIILVVLGVATWIGNKA